MSQDSFTLDGTTVPFEPGQTLFAAARAAGEYIPSLCWHPDFPPHGSCRMCMVNVDGYQVAACTAPAQAGMTVSSDTSEMNDARRTLLQMLFVEGNHFCPSCEKSGNCDLQALARDLQMTTPRFPHFSPNRRVDASHPDTLLDFNRCIFCELCVRASRDQDGKSVFALKGRGIDKKLAVNAESGRLADTDFAADDAAAHICPVGVILHKRVGFAVPIGKRMYDGRSHKQVSLSKVDADD